jgi:4-amino-4-deoxy-L-arabinose transferase-like glycosyltransferase
MPGNNCQGSARFFVNRALTWVSVVLPACFILTFIVVALFRIRYPYELEWMEGAAVDHVRRILAGQKLYVAPTLDFVPFIYPPFYFYLCALPAKILGAGFFPLRLVSFLSSLGSIGLIFLLVKRATGDRWSAFLAAGLFGAAYKISGVWYDIARVDSLFLLLSLWALYVLKPGGPLKNAIGAGSLAALAFFTKQSAAPVFLPLAVYLIIKDRRSGFAFAVTFGLLAGGGTVFLNLVHHGFYNYYVIDLPRQHAIIRGLIPGFWINDILARFPLAIGLILAGLAGPVRKRDRRDQLLFGLAGLGMLGGSWFSRIHYGGYSNVLIPAYAAIALLGGRAAADIKLFLRNKARRWEPVFSLLIAAQFAILFYNPIRQVPTRRDEEAGRAFVRTMAGLPGDIYVPFHGYLPALGGKKMHAQQMAVFDVVRGGDCPNRTALIDDIRRRIQNKTFSALIVDEPWFPELTVEYYSLTGGLFKDSTVFWPVTGARTRPEYLLVPRLE